MALFSRIAGGFRALVRSQRAEQELDDELREYLERAVEERVAAGMSRADASRAVRVETGSVAAVKDRVREVGWESIVGRTWQDMRFASRMLRRQPTFAAAAIATLALGIGGVTAVFSVVDALFLRSPGGLTDAGSLRRLFIHRDAGSLQTPGGGPGSWADYLAMRGRTPAFAGIGAYFKPELVDLGRGAAAERIHAGIVSHDFLEVLGVRPAVGRLFLVEEDGIPGAHPVALISHAMWLGRFGGTADVLGKTLLLNGVHIAIVGVTAKGFDGIDPDPVDVWVPSALSTTLGIWGSREERDWRLVPDGGLYAHYVARLQPSADDETANGQAGRALTHAAEASPALDPTPEVRTAPLVMASAGITGRSREVNLSLWLTVVAAFVLLIACANVANLLLARALARRRELAVRLSLGAGRWRVVRQYLTESAVLALLGGLCGVLVAYWGMALMQQFPLPPAAGIIDARLLMFALGVSLLTGVVFAILPAWRAVDVDPAQALKQSRTAGALTRTFTRRALVVVQVSLTLLLLVGASLFVRSLRQVNAIDGGVDLDRLLVATVDLKRNAFTPAARDEFYDTALARLSTLPGVERASIVHFQPFSGLGMGVGFIPPGRTEMSDAAAAMNLVGPDYFETVGTRLLRGRTIDATDTRAAGHVAVVNEALARLLIENADPVGLCIPFNVQVRRGGCTRIVGVVETQRNWYLDADPVPMLFRPRAQIPEAIPYGTPSLIVRTHGDPATRVAAVRAALQGIRGDLPFVAVRPLADELRGDLLPYRLAAMLFSLFGVLALALAALGLYGVLGYFVTERTVEIGIRRALGAPRSAVLALVLRQGLMPVGAGIALGLAVAFAGTRYLASLLFGVEARDPTSFAVAAGFLALVAFAAILLPALRAARVDPLIALRQD
jgi:predicted permease